ncbi:hypothetical protein EVAR_88128_1 [Eumeta japonica]|uniref:Protein kinase domain-containing protein n=1 Tax=Eumeta variegata TaxID=151549 RepID=A0A4C1WT00_EUMVA|nr:hypothetical protein EVAR_88128_1 [Eumeta japonica]
MNSGTRRALTGSIHKIREFELEKVCLVEEFDILQIVGEGWFGKILLVEHRASDTEIVLKALPKPYVSVRDFYREFHYGLHLSAHKNIVTTFDVAFETAGFYVFCQEYAPLVICVYQRSHHSECDDSQKGSSVVAPANWDSPSWHGARAARSMYTEPRASFRLVFALATGTIIRFYLYKNRSRLLTYCIKLNTKRDLTSNMLDTGIGEIHTKRVAKQLASALEHIHQRELVHRDVKLDNILIFKSDFSRIKLCDFGETRKVNSIVRRRNEWLPYSPPEVLKLPMDTSYKAVIVHDIWQFGIVIFICLTGCLPWQKAAFDDPRYTSYYNWYNSANPLKKQPKLWKMVSSKAQRMFKKFVEPREDRRAGNLQDLYRYMDDRWLAKGYTDRIAGGDIDELCPSMYSYHSDPNEKNILLKHFLHNGVEVTVNRQEKKQRIKEWIQNSVIEEGDEEEDYEPSVYDDSDGELEDTSRGYPLDDSHRVTLRYDTDKHINPRTGEVIEGVQQAKTNNQLSYDVQNLEPVAPADVVRNYGVKENGSHSSTRDSAYGSMEVKVNNSKASSQRSDRKISKMETLSNSPSRSLSGSSIQKNRSPLSNHAQRIQRSEEVYSEELNSSRSQSSSATLQSSGNAKERGTTPILTQSGFSPGAKNAYVAMKDTIYDMSNSRADVNNLEQQENIPVSPHSSMMNIVQGQMKINPHGKTNQNVVNVSVTPIKDSNRRKS